MRSDNPVAAAVERYNSDPLNLVQIVREAQAALGWLSRHTQGEIADRLKIPFTHVEGVVTFYSFLYDKPRGAYRLLLSDNITDRMQGNQALLERLLGRFGVQRGEVSADGLVSVDLTSCTGMCDQGPAMLVNNVAVPHLDEARIDRIAELIEARTPLDRLAGRVFSASRTMSDAPSPLLQAPMTPGRALDAAIAMGREGLLNEMKRSNLRGRGGAGFATGLKWEACRNAPGAERYIVCNADEGEPGAFKDRVLLTSHAGRLFEGMAIAGYAVGATRGLPLSARRIRVLEVAAGRRARAHAAGAATGPAIRGCAGFDFDVEIHVGAGAYVCGEETALAGVARRESQGGRASGRPSLSLTAISAVRRWSTTSRRSARRPKSPSGAAPPSPDKAPSNSTGTKLLSVSGDCEWPGMYEYPFGVRDRAGARGRRRARDTAAVQIGGPSGVLHDSGSSSLAASPSRTCRPRARS